MIIPRKNSDDAFRTVAMDAASAGKWEGIRILSMQPDDSAEKRVVGRLTEALSADIIVVRSLDALCTEIASADMVVSQRYHGALAAMALGKPVTIVVQKEGDKLHALRENVTLGAEDVRRGADHLREALGIEGA